MTIKLLCLYIFILSASYCFSQDRTDIDVTRVTKITLLNPGISYENRLGTFQTLYLQAFLNTSAYFSFSSALGTSSAIYFDPAFTAQYRYYYNEARRQLKGKRTALNSSNYISPVYELTFSKDPVSPSIYKEEKRRAIHKVELVWGMQRNYEKRFSFDLNLGVGYLFTKGIITDNTGQNTSVRESAFTTVGQLNLGFWLNKRR